MQNLVTSPISEGGRIDRKQLPLIIREIHPPFSQHLITKDDNGGSKSGNLNKNKALTESFTHRKLVQ